MLLVTGATGIVGRHVVHTLAQTGIPLRAVVRTRATLLPEEFGTTELVAGELTDARTLNSALRDVQTVVLITRPHAELVAHDRTVLAAARDRRVPRVVKLSIAGASSTSPVRVGRWHAESEALLHGAGFDYAIVRAHRPMQHLYAQIDSLCSQRAFYGCQGDGVAVDVDVRDVAAVIAQLAQRPRLSEQVHEVTGPAQRTAHEVSHALGSAMGHEVRYVDCAPDDFVRGLLAGGVSRSSAEDRAAWQTLLRTGPPAEPSGTVQELTGRAPRSMASFAAEFAESIRFARAPMSREQSARLITQAAPT